jgi:SPP1 family predicted phage head-tail adaptor
MPAASGMDRRVTVERRIVTQNDIGEQVETWTTWRTIWATRRDVRADEPQRADQELVSVTAVWTAHWPYWLTTHDKLVADGLIWDITGIAEIGGRAGVEVTATAVLP